MKFSHWSRVMTVAVAILFLGACTNPTGSGTTPGVGDVAPGAGSVGGTDKAKINFEQASSEILGASAWVYNPGDSLTKVATDLVTAVSTDYYYAGAQSLQISGVLQDDQYSVAGSPTAELGIRIKVQAASGGATATYDLTDRVISLWVYAPADSANSLQIAEGSNYQQSISPAVALTPGRWNQLFFKADTANLKGGKPGLTQVDASYGFLKAGAYTSASFDSTKVDELEVRILGAAIGDPAMVYVDSITWTNESHATKAAAPAVSVAAGTYHADQSVTLTSGSEGAVIKYTLDGSDPLTNWATATTYGSAITIDKTETLKAAAKVTGLDPSSVTEAAYVLTPTITPSLTDGASFTDAQTLTLVASPAAASVYWTVASGAEATVPADPTTDSSTGSVTLAQPATVGSLIYTVKAIAVKEGWTNSPVATYTYTIVKPAPTQHTVTFDLNYVGSTGAPGSQVITDGNQATTPTAPTRDGYLFRGWYSDAACTTAFVFTSAITADTTIYAKWIEGLALPLTSLTKGDAQAVSAQPTFNADGTVTYIADYRYGGGGASFFIKADKSAVDLTGYSSIVVKYTATATNSAIVNKLVFKAFTTSTASYWTSTNLSYMDFSTGGAGTITKTAPTTTGVYGLGLGLNASGYTGDTTGTDKVTITIQSIELVK